MNAQMQSNPLTEALSQLIAEQIKKATGAPQGPMLHGPGGQFGIRGLERGLISTHIQITSSLGTQLSMRPSIDAQPLFPYITGFVRSDGQEKNAVCDTPEEAGQFKTCIQTTIFGRKEFKTREVEVNAMGSRINRGEFMDLQLENSPLVNQFAGLMQGFYGNLNNSQAQIGGQEMMMRILEVGVAFERWLCPKVFTGNPANNSAGGGYKEFPGLDMLIGTNKIDALTGTSCPSLYSDVKSFGYRQVNSAVDPDIVRTITTMMRILKRKAVQQNLAPVDIRIVMREDLFYHLTEVWPCRYITYRCDNIDGATNIDPVGSFSVESMYRMKVEMREGNYLMVDGMKVPVIFDDCIPEDNHADNGAIPIGGFASDIYFVPFSARGGTLQTLYWEYKDFRNAVLPEINSARASGYFWSDSGTFLWGLQPPHVWCIDLIAKVEPRLILRTPQLAGRLTDVVYVPLQHTDDPLPSQDYWVNGGVNSGRPAPSPFSEWNPGGPGFNN